MTHEVQQDEVTYFIMSRVLRWGYNLYRSVDDVEVPQGLAGNSAYLITPKGAKKLLDKVREVGLWPNDAVMCKQFFPWMQVVYPYYTTIQRGLKSTTSS